MPTTIMLGPKIISHLTVPRVNVIIISLDDSMRDEEIYLRTKHTSGNTENTSRITLPDFCTTLEMQFKNSASYLPYNVNLICSSDTANLVFEKIDAWCYEWKEHKGYEMSNEEFIKAFTKPF